MLLGRLLADPELHCTPTGERVATFHVTTAAAAPGALERWRCLAWNQGERQLADLVVEHLRAGDVVYVEGRLPAAPQQDVAAANRCPAVLLARDVQLLESKSLGAGGKRRSGVDS
jgi:single-stranded DNA-binding protein